MINNFKINNIIIFLLFFIACSEKENSTSNNVDVLIISPNFSFNSTNKSFENNIVYRDTAQIKHNHEIKISAKSKSGIESLEVLLFDPLKGQTTITLDSVFTFDPYVQNFNSTNYPDTLYKLIAIAVNADDSVGTDTVIFNINNSKYSPDVKILDIPKDSVVYGKLDVDVEAKSKALIGGTIITKDDIDYVQIQLGEIVKIDSVFPYQFSIDLLPFKDGKYSLKAKAFDKHGLKKEDQVEINIENMNLYPIKVEFAKTYYNPLLKRAELYWIHLDDSFNYKIYSYDQSQDKYSSITNANILYPEVISDTAKVFIGDVQIDKIKYYQLEVCNNDSFCTKSSMLKFSSLVTFEDEIDEVSELSDVKYLPCGTFDCFSIVGGGKINDGLHRTYDMIGNHSFTNKFSLIEETIGDGRGSKQYRFPKSLIIENNSYYITGNIGKNDSISIPFLSKENDQGFSAFSFKEFNKGYGVEISLNKTKEFVIGGTFINSSYTKYPFFSTFSSDLIQDNAKSFVDTVSRFLDNKKAQVILNTALTTKDGGFVASGYYKTINRNELFFHKYNQNGQINWIYRTNHDSSFSSSIKSMIELPSGDLIGVGQINQNNQPKTLVVKLSSSGQFQWSSYFNHGIEGNKIILVNNNDIMVAGTSNNIKGSLIKLDSGGRELWKKEYPNFRKINSIAQISNGGYVIVGSSISNNGILKKIGSMGEIE